MLKRLALALAGLALALGLVELGVAWLRPQPPFAVPGRALLRGPLTQPGTHRVVTGEFDVDVYVNRQGFVDREWGPKPADRPRVAVIGDSFVQAAQVPLEAGFGRRLEQALGEAGRPAEVLSLGVPGAGTATALGLLDEVTPGLAPDLVLLGFLVSNDVLNNHPLLEGKDDKPFYALRGGALRPVDAEGAAAPTWLVSPPLSWSHAARWLGRSVAARRASARRLAAGGGVPLELRVHDPTPDPVWAEAWAVTEALIEAMAQRCEARGVGFVVLLFPDAAQSTREGAARARAAWPEASGWDLTAAQSRAAALAARHAPALDLLPALREADGGPPLYFAEDGHWTARGHEVAARAAAEGLLGAGLLRDAARAGG